MKYKKIAIQSAIAIVIYIVMLQAGNIFSNKNQPVPFTSKLPGINLGFSWKDADRYFCDEEGFRAMDMGFMIFCTDLCKVEQNNPAGFPFKIERTRINDKCGYEEFNNSANTLNYIVGLSFSVLVINLFARKLKL